MLRLFFMTFKNQCVAQLRKPLEFFSSVLAIILNNSFYLYGIYLLSVLSVGDNIFREEYLVSTAMVLTSWGLLNVFAGGLYDLGALIENGELEIHLAKPRTALFLVAISKSNLVSFGELIQGILTIIFIAYLDGFSRAASTLACSMIMTFAFAAVIIFIGSFSFFSSRGSQLSSVLLQLILSLSLFPIDRALKGREQWIFYASPLLITATLPRYTVFHGGPYHFLIFSATTFGLFICALLFFNFGLKRYESKNYVSLMPSGG